MRQCTSAAAISSAFAAEMRGAPARVRLVDLANHGTAQFDVDRGRRYAAGVVANSQRTPD